jgi:transcriptional regulator with XRE-family HTH domain
MNQKNALGTLLKGRRAELALSQRTLARQLGVKPSHIAYLESGKRKPSLALMGRLEEALGIGRQRIFLLAHPEAEAMVNPVVQAVKPKTPADAWHRFATDRPFLKRHGVTPRELRAFKRLSLLGYVLSRHQFLAILIMIREPADD